MLTDDLRRRRLAVLDEHFRSAVIAVFFAGDRITNERVYLDGASLLRQIG